VIEMMIGEKKTADIESAVSLPYLHPVMPCATNKAFATKTYKCKLPDAGLRLWLRRA
jgi:hypothetical protein